VLAALAVLAPATPAGAHRPLTLGIHEPDADGGDTAVVAELGERGAQMIRSTVGWREVAPEAASKPAGFDAADPADPQYRWGRVDAFVRAAHARGLKPLITTLNAPDWAEGSGAPAGRRRSGNPGTWYPDAAEYGLFSAAVARRYSGTFPDPANPGRALPRVRYHQLWNEPNLRINITTRVRAEAADVYLRLLNAGYAAVKAVDPSNVVISGGLATYGRNGAGGGVQPQAFMRRMLCLTGSDGRGLRERRGCRQPPARFDRWGQQPYSLDRSSPTDRPVNADSGTLADLPAIRRTLDAATRYGNLLPRRRSPIWVTEFGWFSNPPGLRAGTAGQQLGKPLRLHAEFLSESAYRSWSAGVEVFLWFYLRDRAPWPGGLQRADGRPKPAQAAFRFPFFAGHGAGRSLTVWGIRHDAGQAQVRIERRAGSRWRRVATLSSDSRGMVFGRVRSGRGTYRAVVASGPRAGTASLAFRSRPR